MADPSVQPSAPLAFSIVHVKYAHEVQTISPGNSFGVQGDTLAADSSSRRRRQRSLEPEPTVTVPLLRGKLRKYSLLFTLLLKQSCSCHPPLPWPDAGSVEARPHCGLCRRSSEGSRALGWGPESHN